MSLQNLSTRGKLLVLKGRGQREEVAKGRWRRCRSLPPHVSSLDGRLSVMRPAFRYSLTGAQTRTLQTVACTRSRNKADRSSTLEFRMYTYQYNTYLITEEKQKGGSEAAVLWLESLPEWRFTQSAPKSWLTGKVKRCEDEDTCCIHGDCKL